MKKPAKAKAAPSSVTALASAPVPEKKKQEPISLGTIGFRNLTPICDGRAAVTITSTTIDSRYEGFLCKPDGTRLEHLIISDMSEAETRADQLIAKGAL